MDHDLRRIEADGRGGIAGGPFGLWSLGFGLWALVFGGLTPYKLD